MKKRVGTGITLFVALIFVLINLPASPAWAGDVAIDEANFPDANFRTYVSTEFDKNKDGRLSQSELDAVRKIDVKDKSITTLKGVEHFTKLEGLWCRENQLTALDVSQNLALKYLNCSTNQLTALDVSQNPALESLSCGDNRLSTLDVTNNPALESLICYKNQLSTLDVTKNTALELILCDENQLTALDVSYNPALKELWCHFNQLTALDVSHNPALELLYCSKNQLSTLDVTKNTALEFLECFKNQLSTLDVTKNPALKTLMCDVNQLTVLDVSHNPALEWLSCSENQLSTLDVTNNPALKWLLCDKNQLSTLDVTKNTALERFSCSKNQLTNMDLTANTSISKYDGQSQEYEIHVDGDALTYDLLSLPGNFDPTKASEWKNGTVLDNTLKLDSIKPDRVTYSYEAGNGNRLSVTLKVRYNGEQVAVSFDPNDGRGTMDSESVGKGVSYTLPTCRFTAPDGKEFKAWNVDGAEKNPGEFIRVNKDTQIKALWTDLSSVESIAVNSTDHKTEYKVGDPLDVTDLTIEVTKPGGTKETVPVTADMVSGFSSAVPATNKRLTISYKNKTTTYTINVTSEKYIVSFDANGGTGTMTDVTIEGIPGYQLPECEFGPPEGKVFDAWEVDGVKKAPGKFIRVNENTRVKALWKEAGQPSKPHGGGVSSSTGTVTKPQEPQKPDEEKPAVAGSSAAYLTGYPDGSIRPNGFVTRAESAKIIASLKGLDLSAGGQPAFKDLASSWYTPYINAVVKQGLMRGYMDGTFKPNAPITRAEFAQMIMPLDKASKVRAPFTDVKDHWAEKAINQAYGNGRIKGYPDGTFRPDGQITRAEAVTICNNFFNRKADKAGLEAALKNPGKIKTFTDLDKSHWAYYEILEAANPHDDQKKA